MRTLTVLVAALLLALVCPFSPPASARLAQSPPPPFRPAVVAGGFIHVSGMLPTDARGQVVAGDIKAQTAQVVANLKDALEKAGGRMQDVAAVNVYLKRAADFAAMNEVYRSAWPADPPARTTVVSNLVMPDALLEISLIGLRAGVERTLIHPSGWVRAPNPYSYAVRSGDTLFLSGLVPRRGADNTPIDGDIAAQTRGVLDNARTILETAGMSLGDVVACRVYITDTAMFQDMNAAYRAYFAKDPPARATVVVGLTAPQYLVEIALTAVKTPDRIAIVTPNADGSPGQANPNLSSAIRAGRRLFVSGMLGSTAATRGDMGAQARETLTRIGRTLAAAGFDWKQVVESTVYITDVARFGAMNDAYRSIVPQPFPARATVETGLVAADGLVEIMVVASR